MTKEHRARTFTYSFRAAFLISFFLYASASAQVQSKAKPLPKAQIPPAATASHPKPEPEKLKVVRRTKLRKTPGGPDVLRDLEPHDEVLAASSDQIQSRERWLKVTTKDGTVGWIYAADLHGKHTPQIAVSPTRTTTGQQMTGVRGVEEGMEDSNLKGDRAALTKLKQMNAGSAQAASRPARPLPSDLQLPTSSDKLKPAAPVEERVQPSEPAIQDPGGGS